jgi:hypothetical protein
MVLACGAHLSRNAMEHVLKSWPDFFEPVAEGVKRFEVRKSDRDFNVGDTLRLQEWDPQDEKYSGREVTVQVEYILGAAHEMEKTYLGVAPGFCVLGISEVLDMKLKWWG